MLDWHVVITAMACWDYDVLACLRAGVTFCGVLELGVLELRRGVLELRFGVLELGVLELHLIACWNYGIGVLKLFYRVFGRTRTTNRVGKTFQCKLA